MNRVVDWRGLQFQVELIDIQQLNERLFRGDFDVAKTSFHAALLLASSTFVLPSGSALGYGVGPLLLSARTNERPQSAAQLTLCPGHHTTAALLYQLYYPNTTRLEHTVFSEIMPALQRQEADFGVCIHEGRFTWQNEGLGLVEDLGVHWEQDTHCPLPLGGIVASRQLPHEVIARVQVVIRDSLEFALEHRHATLPTMRQYAQEFDDQVLFQHVDLYVNQWTVELGLPGQLALDQLSERACSVGLLPVERSRLEVFQP